MSQRPVRYRGTEYPVIDRFRLGARTYLAVTKIGSAGRQAYRVYDTASKTMRVLHILPDSAGTLERVRTLQRLTRGDNEILQILEYSREHGKVFVVLPWIDGFNLRTVLMGIRERGKLRIAAPEAVRLAKGTAHALRHLHKGKGIIHGDVKPANLLLTKRTSLVLIDYGNAWTIDRTATRHEGDGVSSGYSAPEFLRGERSVDFRADCFSLGVVLYEMLTDKIPYDGHGGKIGLLSDSLKSGSRLVPASEISPERDKISKRVWRPIDELLRRSLAIDAKSRFETPSRWLDAWSAGVDVLRQVKQHPQSPNLAVRLLDWVESRLR